MRLPAFEPNDYRKRVLAAVEARGGPQASDPFELYDLPLDGTERVSDGAVADRVAEVWAFWQRQRDHPKYRALVAALVAAHDSNTASLLDGRSRAALAARVRQDRAGRDAARFALFEGAVAALIARHGGIPRDKLTRLEDVGRDSGLTPAEVAGRVRMHHIVDPAPTPTVLPVASGEIVPEHRWQQVRALLDELGRIWECPPPATLLALLDCEAGTDDRQVAMSAAALRARARELPSDRVRTVIDELLVHIGDLLESGPAMRGAYLDGVAADVAEKLRPRVRAAVLVEDRLTVDDQAHLVAEAADLGLDAARAGRVLAALAAELGAPVDDMPAGRPTRPPSPQSSSPPPPAPGAARAWEASLRAARGALRGGRPVEAGRLAEDARRIALPERQPSITAVADEIDTVLAEARLQWRAASSALEARRFAEAADHLEHLARVAADLPDPTGTVDAGAALARARAAVTEADQLVEAAMAGPESARSAGLLAALATCPGHPGALAALTAIPLAGPVRVRAERVGTNDVTVSWEPVSETGAMYKVTRLVGDGSWRTVGRTAAASITDGGAPDGPTPVYGVATVQAGRSSEPTRSDAPGLPTPREVRARRGADGTVIVTWATPGTVADVEYQVARLTPDGTWRVLGRTRATTLEDGGAPPGSLPVYGVAARLGPASSERATSGPA